MDLYGGTRHTTTTEFAKRAGQEKTKKMSGHGINKAFDRYCQIGDDDTFDISQLMAKMRGRTVSFDQTKVNIR